MDFGENVTLRLRRRRSESEIETFDDSSNNSTLDGATNNSVPNITNEDNEEMGDLKRQISELNSQLQAAHEEIDILSFENTELKKTIENMNIKHKLVEKVTKKLASEVTTPKQRTKLSTPLRESLQKQHLEDSSRYGSPDIFKSSQVTLQDELVQPKHSSVDKEVLRRNIATQTINIQTPNELKQQVTSSSQRQGENSKNLARNITKPKQKNKLCILSSVNRSSLSAIVSVFSEYFVYCHYIMSNCTLYERLKNIEQKLKHFTINDYCLLFIEENDIKEENDYINMIKTIKELLKNVAHTNIVICAPTYQIGAPIYNYKVEIFNNLLCTDLQNNNSSLYYFDSNRDLSLDMFSYKSGKINRSGIMTILKQIMNNILIDLNIAEQTNIEHSASEFFRV